MDTNSQVPHEPEALAAEVAEHQDFLRKSGEWVQGVYKAVQETEDEYRLLGMKYHTVNERGRNPEYFPGGELQRLKRAFEMESDDEYNAYFAHHHSLSQVLDTIRSEIRLNGTHQELMERVQNIKQTRDRYNTLMETVRHEALTLKKDFDIFVSTACFLIAFSDHSDELWWIPIDDLPRRTETDEEPEEWKKLCAWIWCLPEVKRAAKCGISVHESAKIMLRKHYSGDKQ
ncbi:hypothetical protein P280DRAFT_524900 [Massarina eburnea CBS 473.64]|uniref:Uncharacterized protein n=1 Tax=Massarina eburnea CBS 473.64 TaxID=1395130 RepID=A0A6A6SE47_9PLEO|nr:hypothetical protein P280DRAFT_524900 [Massarina eburnea CBS 473.64]